VIDGLALDLLAAPARGLPVLEAPTPAQVRGIIAFHVLADDFTMNQVSRLGRRVAQELLGSRAHKGILKFEILNLKYLNSFRSKSASIKSVFINLLSCLAVRSIRGGHARSPPSLAREFNRRRRSWLRRGNE